MYQRIVCFKFRAGTSEEAIRAHMQRFAALADAIPQIASYQGGRAVDDPNEPTADYDSLHTLTFASLEDIDIYFHHAAHQRFIAENKAVWERALVMNAAVD